MRLILISIFCLTILGSCKKYLEPDEPKTQLTSTSIFNSDVTAIAAQLSIYVQMEATGLFYSLTLYPGLSADELSNHSVLSDQTDISVNNVTPANFHVNQLWSDLYKYIYQANAILEGLTKSGKLTEATKSQLRGESLFVRALCHYYLVNLFGAVPVISTTNYIPNSIPIQASSDSVYRFITGDLIEAGDLLSENYLSGYNTISTERVRPTRWAAAALLARVFLHQQRWADAEEMACIVINSGKYQLLNDLNAVFLKNSNEAIWQLMSVIPGSNTYAGGTFILTTVPYISSVSAAFIDSYQPDDLRKAAWTNSFTESGNTFYYPFKYKVPQNVQSITEYTMVLRLSEQLLIRAEARAMQDNLTGAESDLNLVRNRAGLMSISAHPKQALVDSIHIERRFELAFECGDRWIDLKRTGKVNYVLSVLKGSDWASTDQLYPIPLAEMNKNFNLEQNAGY